MTRVFISYSRTDMEFVQRLATDLKNAGLDVWWDLSGIQGSDVWEQKIEEGLRNCEYFIVVLTPASLESRWVRREYLSADNRGIRIIPLRLKSYDETPLTLRDIQPIEAIGREYDDVVSDVLRIVKGDHVKVENVVSQNSAAYIPEKESQNRFVELLLTKGTSGVDVGGTLPLVAFFLLMAFELLGPADDAVRVLLGVSAALAGIFFLLKKLIPETPFFRYAGSLFLLAYGLVNYSDYYGAEIPFIEPIAGVAAVLASGVLLFTIQKSKKPIYISAFALAIILFFIAAKMYALYMEDYETLYEMPIMITSAVTAILLWRDL
ncbi:MAG TPA: TIR domain-containing protein [Anaerolineales bacterium]|nr:TIR domain-containing protein [Anaerolineales bacterium]